jgi:nucleotide-binding universal stress UspA family protein
VFRAIERDRYDLVILGFNFGEDQGLAEEILHWGEHHLLLVPSPQPAAPVSALICASSGEPGKEDVLFAGRLVRHLGADATLLSVLPVSGGNPELRARTERFLEGGIQSLSLMGVPAKGSIRTGPAAEQIVGEMKDSGCDLLVMGAPLMKEPDRISLTGVVGQVLSRVIDQPILIVRSHYLGARTYRLPAGEPEAILPDTFR